ARMVPFGWALLCTCTGIAASSRTRDSKVSNRTVDAGEGGSAGRTGGRLPCRRPRRLLKCLNRDPLGVSDTAGFPPVFGEASPRSHVNARTTCDSAINSRWHGPEPENQDQLIWYSPHAH